MSELFDVRSIWLSQPQKAFDAFVQSPEFLELGRRLPEMALVEGVGRPRPLRKSTANTYRAMFGNFLRWLDKPGHNIAFLEVTSDQLRLFLEERHGDDKGKKKLNSTIRVRYLRLLERVFAHLDIDPNPARHAAFDMYNQAAGGKDVAKVILSEAQQQAFLAALPVRVAVNPYDDETAGWKQRRDRAMQAMMLGAGLKVSEVIGIYTENIGQKDSTGSIPITISPGSAGGVVRWHRTQLRPFAAPEVVQWLSERKALKIPGPLLFPATLQGGCLNKATVYRQTKATFARAGIAVPRQGGRTLRNSFAHRELAAGESVELVGEFLGHRLRKSTEVYAPKKSKKPA